MENVGRNLLVLLLLTVFSSGHGWGGEGHQTVCAIAERRLGPKATAAVRQLLPRTTRLSESCLWADQIRPTHPWTNKLHYINTPDNLWDCNGIDHQCLAGAITNYTAQLLDYNHRRLNYNLTEALLFLSHFIGDIHQPLHVGYTSDRGGSTIRVKWNGLITTLHYVWDTSMIRKAMATDNINVFIRKLQTKIDTQWTSKKIAWKWGNCSMANCPNGYAAESVDAACNHAYVGVANCPELGGHYYNTKYHIVEERLAKAGLRLAATLNRIFGDTYTEPTQCLAATLEEACLLDICFE